MADFVALLLVQTRDALALVVLLAVEYATHLRSLRLDGLRSGAVPPWWRDRAYRARQRSELVNRLWVLLALEVTFVWTNHAGLEGAARLVTVGVGLTLLMRLWANLARGDGLARAVRSVVARLATDRLERLEAEMRTGDNVQMSSPEALPPPPAVPPSSGTP